jgi:hypothetical protein
MTTTYQKQRKSGKDAILSSNHGNDNNNNSAVDKYIKSIKIMSKSTSYEYLKRLNSYNKKEDKDPSKIINCPDSGFKCNPAFPPSKLCELHPKSCRHHNDDDNNDNNIQVIHKTVVVHDKDNNPQTILVNSNLQGTCFVSSQQVVDIPGLVTQLLNQCTSVTITP